MAFQFGVNPRTISDWLARGCPGKPRRYPLPEVLAWYLANIKPDPIAAPQREPTGLDRMQDESARIKQLQRMEMEGKLVDKDEIRDGLTRCAAHLRAAGDRLQKEFGPDAFAIYDEALQEFEDSLDEAAADEE